MTREERKKLERIGENMRFARKRAGLTQMQVHRRLGISQNTVCNYEYGKRAASSLKMIRLAKLYGCSIADFAEGV